MILHQFLANRFPPKFAAILAVLGYALLLLLFILGYSAVNADLRYANI